MKNSFAPVRNDDPLLGGSHALHYTGHLYRRENAWEITFKKKDITIDARYNVASMPHPP